MLYVSEGYIDKVFSINDKFKYISLIVEQSISDYYRCLIPKWLRVQRQKYPAHVTLLRTLSYEAEIDYKLNKRFEFVYDSNIKIDETYAWLNVYCHELCNWRYELGLPDYEWYNLPPSINKDCFHLTIGNFK